MNPTHLTIVLLVALATALSPAIGCGGGGGWEPPQSPSRVPFTCLERVYHYGFLDGIHATENVLVEHDCEWDGINNSGPADDDESDILYPGLFHWDYRITQGEAGYAPSGAWDSIVWAGHDPSGARVQTVTQSSPGVFFWGWAGRSYQITLEHTQSQTCSSPSSDAYYIVRCPGLPDVEYDRYTPSIPPPVFSPPMDGWCEFVAVNWVVRPGSDVTTPIEECWSRDIYELWLLP